MTRATDPIGRVLSTGTAAIRPEQAGPAREPVLWRLLTSAKRTDPEPVNVFVGEMPGPTVLAARDPNAAALPERAEEPYGNEDSKRP